ncbi:uncharacterized protein LOC102407301 [Bubalus bubalis]|uniref:uncharacterized protein LOC102407301 n=1 Tax=Bubalus bubalis TaxID=89462 RepID=UPI001D11EEA4|nr:uncharacterized protein LOC102407301 [Bubalus bubalis]
MGRAVPEETAAARATRALAPPAPRPRQGPGAWPVGGARAEPPPLHAPRARRAPGGAAGPRGQRGCGLSTTSGCTSSGPTAGFTLSSVSRKTRLSPQRRPRPGSPGTADRRAGGRERVSTTLEGLEPPLPEVELVYLPGGGSVPALPRALFGNRAEELAARACDHAVRAAPKGATPAIQVKAALQRKRVTLTGRALPLSSPAQTVRGMSEPEQFHKVQSLWAGPPVMMEKFCTCVSSTHLLNAASETKELNFIFDLMLLTHPAPSYRNALFLKTLLHLNK